MADSETDRLAALKTQVKLMELEEKFRDAKAKGKVTDKMKADLRAARYDYRTNHRPAPKSGASPGTIGVTVGVNS